MFENCESCFAAEQFVDISVCISACVYQRVDIRVNPLCMCILHVCFSFTVVHCNNFQWLKTDIYLTIFMDNFDFFHLFKIKSKDRLTKCILML